MLPCTIAAHSSGELPPRSFPRGRTVSNPLIFGNSQRCASGNPSRLRVGHAGGGFASAAEAGDPSISARSVDLEHPIPPGLGRYDQACFRGAAARICSALPASTFDASRALKDAWQPAASAAGRPYFPRAPELSSRSMTRVEGMLSVDELRTLVSSGQIETVLVVFTDAYGRFMGKRFDADFFLDDALAHGAHACDYLLTVDMEMAPVPGYRFANWERGYGDFHLVPDLATLRTASWLERTAMVLCDVADVKTNQPVAVAPRSILRRQIERAAEAGYTAMASSELEYYVFRDSYRDAAKKGCTGLEPMGWYLEDYHILQGTRTEGFHALARRHLKQSGVPVENSKGEWGLGQHELNVRYADALEMADRHCVFKQCLKETADRLGISVTFMAKLAADQAGSSCHIHMSLWKGTKSAFPGAKKLGAIECSDAFRWFLGGWIGHANELMPLYAPTVNSYKRYQAASWAPTRLAWSYDNRTAGFRVVGKGQSLRIECRIPGADCNPYLAYAAALASGLDGIEKRTEPPPMFEGDMYAAEKLPRVPATLREATDLLASSAFAKKAFGADVVEHYAHFFRTEQAAWDKAVTDWERQRYFERI